MQNLHVIKQIIWAGDISNITVVIFSVGHFELKRVNTWFAYIIMIKRVNTWFAYIIMIILIHGLHILS